MDYTPDSGLLYISCYVSEPGVTQDRLTDEIINSLYDLSVFIFFICYS